jgi:hypothetical protein
VVSAREDGFEDVFIKENREFVREGIFASVFGGFHPRGSCF